MLSALDSDVVKTYVELGLGIGIVASVAFNSQRDSNPGMLDCTRIFEANTTHAYCSAAWSLFAGLCLSLY
ncbi:MAG: hypothetical protein ACH34X_12895 [Thiolinea sp.]